MKDPDVGTQMSAADKAALDAKLEHIVRLGAMGMSQLGTLRKACEDLEAWVKSLPEPVDRITLKQSLASSIACGRRAFRQRLALLETPRVEHSNG